MFSTESTISIRRKKGNYGEDIARAHGNVFSGEKMSWAGALTANSKQMCFQSPCLKDGGSQGKSVLLEKIVTRNNAYFEEEIIKLERWTDKRKILFEMQIK